MENNKIFINYRKRSEISFIDKKKKLIENQKLHPKKSGMKRVYIKKNMQQSYPGNLFFDLMKIKKRSLLLTAACLLIFSSFLPIYINLNSYFWEKNRVLHRENDIIYNLFLVEGIEEQGSGPGTNMNKSYSLPALKIGAYRVKKGDSLFGISHKFNVTVDTIITANNLINAQYLKIGTVLKIPNMSGIFYTVKRGDSLSEISRKYSVSINRIADSNDLSSSVIRLRQKLFIPGGSLSDWERAVAIGTLFKVPVKGRLTSKIGFRIDPFTKKRTYHAGIDIANRVGTPVRAAQYGKVVYAGYRGNFGKMVIIIHPQGYRTVYAHLHKITVKKGQAVKQGERIGSLGSSGRSTGPHLHFEVHQNRKILDPLKIIKLN